MAQTGSLPPASIYGTWVENVEIVDVEDGTPFDLTNLTEITLLLKDQTTRNNEMTLTLTGGGISIIDTGVLEWRVEVGAMGTILPKLYEVVLLLEDSVEPITVPLILGTVSITE